EVAHAAVGHDGRRTASPGPQGEDVAEGAGGRVAAGLDHDDLALLDGVEGALLGVVAAAVRGEQVLAEGHEAQRLGGADDLAARDVRGDPVDEAGVVPAL